MRIVTNILLFTLALYAAVYGVTYAYLLHHLVNGLCAWLVVIHLTNGSVSATRLKQWVWDQRRQGHVKKRP